MTGATNRAERLSRRAKLIAFVGILSLIAGLGLTFRAQSMGESSFGEYVKGLGMVFIMSENSVELEQWYADNIGIEVGFLFAEFTSRDLLDPEKLRTTLWGIAPREDSDTFPAEAKGIVIGYEVENLDGLVAELAEKGIEPAMPRETNDETSMAYYMDPEGNLVGLVEYYSERRMTLDGEMIVDEPDEDLIEYEPGEGPGDG